MTPVLRIIDPPARNLLAVSLKDAKVHLGIESSDFDVKVERLIRAATGRLAYLGRAILPAKYAWDMWGFPSNNPFYFYRPFDLSFQHYFQPIELPMPPLIAITAIKTQNADDTFTTLDPTTYQVDVSRTGRARLYPSSGYRWPLAPFRQNAVTIEFTAGYNGTTWEMPAEIETAILLIVGGMFENRSEYTAGPMSRLPDAIDNLLGDLRILNV